MFKDIDLKFLEGLYFMWLEMNLMSVLKRGTNARRKQFKPKSPLEMSPSSDYWRLNRFSQATLSLSSIYGVTTWGYAITILSVKRAGLIYSLWFVSVVNKPIMVTIALTNKTFYSCCALKMHLHLWTISFLILVMRYFTDILFVNFHYWNEFKWELMF